MDKMKYKDICDKHEISMNTLKSWVSRNSWSDERKGLIGKGAHKEKKGAHKKQSKSTIGNKNKPIEYKSEIEKLEDADLTDKQRLFCIEYIKCFNATKAYKKVYGCSYNAAKVEGFRHLTNPNIKDEIKSLKQAKLNRAMLDEDDIFQKYIDIAFADVTDYIDYGVEDVPLMDTNTGKQIADGEGNLIYYKRNYVLFKDGKEADGTIISEVSKGRDGVKVKLQDKMKALQWLSDRVDLLPTQVSEKLKIEKEKLEMEKMRNQEDIEEYEDDGFIDALKSEVSEVWDDYEKD